MSFNDVTHNRETQPQPSVHSCRERVALTEFFKNVRQELTSDTDAGILNQNTYSFFSILEAYLDRSSGLSEFNRIRKQVPNDLLNAVAIAPDGLTRLLQ